MTARWRAAPPGDLVWVDWGEHCALYHRPSGKTHFVNDTTARILREVLREPADAGNVCAALGLAGNPVADPGSAAGIAALLERLEALGLLERVGP